MKKELLPFKKGQTVQVNSKNTMFMKDMKVIILVPNALCGTHKIHSYYGSENVMVTHTHLYKQYDFMSPDALFDLWRRSNCDEVPIFVYEDYKFKAIAENNADHARYSLDTMDNY